ncbi:DNA ligase 4 [Nematostella vectensis]|uniref:DNA ligase 4 n=1 Tax=Nematostella vectensis TaxID=45351 RepID=UPI002076E342|nr:DNA ligase 4 [Nematostella vectensis]
MADSRSPSVASQVPFFNFCMAMERICEAKGSIEKKRDPLRKLISSWREAHRRIHGSTKTTDSLFPLLRLLLPHLDKDRPAYGMKENIFAKYIIDVMSLGKDSSSGCKLLNYRHPSSSKQDSQGDFASVAYFVLKDRCPEKGSLKIEEVNKLLDDMANANLEKKRDNVKMSIQMLLRKSSAKEVKWLIRIILKELKMGLGENSVFAVFHPDALDHYNTCNNLSKVCMDLHDPSVRMNEAEITIFSAFRPMLAQWSPLNQVEDLMKNQPFYIETKMDGERFILHKHGDKYRYFSRGGNDFTHTFGENSREGCLTPKINDCFERSIHSCILDGEMLVYDTSNEIFITKAMHVDVKSAATFNAVRQPCFVVFDVLLYNGKKLANTPLHERLKLLETVFKPRLGFLQFVERQNASSNEEVIKSLNEAIDRREEGLVVKSRDSVYKPNVRNGGGWLKIKPEYVASLSDDLDVVIVGGYFGVGRRQGMVSHFLCAVAVPSDRRGEKPSQFYSLCKVGSGYTMNELDELGQQLKPHWQPFNQAKPPKSVCFTPGFKEKPDVWIEPSKSKVVQIKAAEITPSEKYRAGFTLRFPRLECVRHDKSWYDCLDLSGLEQLLKKAEGKLTSRHTSLGEESAPAKKRSRTTQKRAEQTRVSVAPQFKPSEVSTVAKVSKLFEGKEFCIVNGPASHPKHSLEKMITQHGGTFTQIPGPETYCTIADRPNVRLGNIIKDGRFDVVQAAWLIDCMNQAKLLPWQPAQMLHTSSATTAKFREEYDRHGDSFTCDATADSLKTVFHNIANDDISITAKEIADIEQRYFPASTPHNLFRTCRVYLDKLKDIDNPDTVIPDCSLELTALELRCHGAHIQERFDETVTHVVFDDRDLSRLPTYQQIMRNRPKKHHFVTESWVTQSIGNERILSERQFAPRAYTSAS